MEIGWWCQTSVKNWVMSDELWVMSDEWWVMEIEWWKKWSQTGSKSLYRKVCNYSAKREKEKAGWVNKVGRNSNSADSNFIAEIHVIFGVVHLFKKKLITFINFCLIQNFNFLVKKVSHLLHFHNKSWKEFKFQIYQQHQQSLKLRKKYVTFFMVYG